MLKTIIGFIAVIATAIFSSTIEKLFLAIGISWTGSFYAAYVLTLLLAILLAYHVNKKLKAKKTLLKIGVTLFLIAGTVALHFALNPIYESDVYSSELSVSGEQIENPSEDLVVFAIPDCPYCHQSVQVLNTLQERNPNKKITFKICSTESRQIEPYRRQLDKRIKVKLAADPHAAAGVVGGMFPSFAIKKGKNYLLYNNNTFGRKSMDQFEQ